MLLTVSNKKEIEDYTNEEIIYLTRLYLEQLYSRNNTLDYFQLQSEYLKIKEHFMGVIIDKIDSLADIFNLDFGINFRTFDNVFKNRKNNANHTSLLLFLDPITEDSTFNLNQEQIAFQAGITILQMVEYILADKNRRQYYLQLAITESGT